MIHEAHYRLVREMQQAGVKLIAGTDGRLFGFDLHDELQEEVKAGLTPMQALQTATRNAAEYFGKLDSMGTVEKGKVADLVLLDASPLDSIVNTTKVRSVVVNGRLLDRTALDHMRAQMKAGANQHSEPTAGFGDWAVK
jgi:imidazolonepropionase-like amidohydrolase